MSFFKYGLNAPMYEALLAKQNNRCAICRELLEGKKACIDHNHAQGLKAVRAILCDLCNRQLGVVEKTEWLQSALAYLAKHRDVR